MRITIITNIYPNRSNPDSGTYIADQINSLRPSTQTAVVSKSQESLVEFLLFAAKSIWASLSGRHDIVHAHYGFHSAFLPLLFGRQPMVVTFHGSDALIEPNRNKLYKFLQKRVVDGAARIVAVSEQVKTELVQGLGASASKICIIPCGVDTQKFRPRAKHLVRTRLGLERNIKLALFIGRLTHAKGVDLLQEASKSLPDVQFYFIGQGPLRWRAPNCKFLGPIDHAKIPEWLNAADVLLLPSRSEGTPVAVLEALASGIPVICSDVGACKEVVLNDHTGMLIPPEDAQALKAALEQVLSWKKFDSKAARQMVVRNFDLGVISKKLHRLYSEVLNDR